MSCILCIDTSTHACSVALSQDGAVIFELAQKERAQHTILLGGYVDQALSFAENHAIPIDAVAVTSGPGSYTGLRIGVSMAKGICYALHVPLISIPTLQLLCVPLLLQVDNADQARFIPMLDARRMEVYTTTMDFSLNELAPTRALVIEEDAPNPFEKDLEAGPVYFVGDGVQKCMNRLSHPNACFMADAVPLAKWMFPLAEKKLACGDTENVAYFEPFYLKEFVATVSKKKLL